MPAIPVHHPRFTLLFGLLLALAGCSDPPPQLRALSASDVVVAFGDSLTYGTGTNAEDSYPAVLGRAIGHPVVRSGVPGEQTPEGLQRLQQVLEQNQPRLLLLCHGGNDILAHTPDSAIKANLARMIRMAQAQGAEVVLVGVPKFGLLLSPAPLYAELAEEFQLPYLADSISDVLAKPALKSDRVHPNADGYRRIATDMQALLREAGAVN